MVRTCTYMFFNANRNWSDVAVLDVKLLCIHRQLAAEGILFGGCSCVSSYMIIYYYKFVNWTQHLTNVLWEFHLICNLSKWVPALAGKAKADMVHSVNGWTRGVQVELWDPLRMHAIPEHFRDVFMTRHYTNPRLPYLTLSAAGGTKL